MDTTVRIRLAGADDASELARLKESWADLADPATEAELTAFAGELRRWMLERGDAVTCAVAESDGVLIGMAWLVVFERVPNIRETRRRSGDIQSVFVHRKHRSHGIGTGLVRALTAKADHLGIPRITVSASAAAASMYDALGFEPTPLLLERKARPALPPQSLRRHEAQRHARPSESRAHALRVTGLRSPPPLRCPDVLPPTQCH